MFVTTNMFVMTKMKLAAPPASDTSSLQLPVIRGLWKTNLMNFCQSEADIA